MSAQYSFEHSSQLTSHLQCRYEDYLDSQITAKDISYLEDVEIVRTLVELGCALVPTAAWAWCVHKQVSHVYDNMRLHRLRGNGEVIKREEFERQRAAALAARNARLIKKPSKLSSQGKDLSQYPLLQVGTATCVSVLLRKEQ